MKKNLFSLLLTTASAIVLTSGNANAALVTQWSVGVNASFDTSSVLWDVSNGSGGARTATPTLLEWGTSTGSGLSSLVLTDANTSKAVNTNGAAVANLSITHNNNPITGVTLDSVILNSILTLTPLVPSLTALPPATMSFLINFKETPNAANPCANGLANYSGININGCADIFVIDKNALNFAFQYDTDGAGGDDPLTYYISFFDLTNGLNPLPTAACTAAGAASPCLGFMTAEDTSTTATFAAMITSRPVQIPEPGSLALLGIALAGMSLYRRRAAS